MVLFAGRTFSPPQVLSALTDWKSVLLQRSQPLLDKLCLFSDRDKDCIGDGSHALVARMTGYSGVFDFSFGTGLMRSIQVHFSKIFSMELTSLISLGFVVLLEDVGCGLVGHLVFSN